MMQQARKKPQLLFLLGQESSGMAFAVAVVIVVMAGSSPAAAEVCRLQPCSTYKSCCEIDAAISENLLF
jgi:hypothetical protein